MSGFVSFVSSGPGDPELMTLKAVKRVAEADVILYDSLSTEPALVHAPENARLVPVGKRAGRPSARQADIIREMIEHARSGAKVVRLKSGDAGIFGRLEEEILALQEAGIGFEIVPGVSAASAAAAAAGIPLTRRNTARRIQFVTGHDVSGALPGDLNLAALADPEATSIVYMARATFPALAERLIATGLSPHTPAILAESVTTAEQSLLRLTLRTLAEYLLANPRADHAPTLVLYGPLAGTNNPD
ncbi:MAG: uroporphyrinogen-III C-methyltransferase [Proteobacteria bacterium]|nr:uroporphyrinogen-III C-methyltransferase [Pseudomonadota bacterium]